MNDDLNIAIEATVPVPQKFRPRPLLDKLNFGESFSFPKNKRGSVSNCVSGYYHKFTDKRFTISDDPENDENDRVWRLQDESKKAS